MPFDVSASESVYRALPDKVHDSGLSCDAPIVDLSDRNNQLVFANEQGSARDLPRFVITEGEQKSDGSRLADRLTSDMEPSEYLEAFDSYLKENGDQLFAEAEGYDLEHPVAAMADILNHELRGTGYAFRDSETEFGIAISKDGGEWYLSSWEPPQ